MQAVTPRRLVLVLVVIAALLLATLWNRARGADLTGPPGAWEPGRVDSGAAERVYVSGEGKNCVQFVTGVAARHGHVYVSSGCSTPAGDEDAPRPDPASAVDELMPDGSVRRLAPASVEGEQLSYLAVEDVERDGTLWAIGRAAATTHVLRRSTDGTWSTVQAVDDPVAVEVAAGGGVYVAGRTTIALLAVDGSRRVVADRTSPGGLGQTDYADQRTPNPRPARGPELPTVTGLASLSDGTLVVLATDVVMTVDRGGTLRTLVSPASSGSEPATRLHRARVRDGGTGSSLVDAIEVGGDILVYDQRGGRLLRVDRRGRLRLVAGGPVNELGGPLRSRSGSAQWTAGSSRTIPLAELLLPVGGAGERAVRLAVPDDGQVWLTAARDGVLRLGA